MEAQIMEMEMAEIMATKTRETIMVGANPECDFLW